MIRITWNNLTPPGYRSEDIVEYLLKPAIFDNPELKEKIKASVFYEREQGEKQQKIFILISPRAKQLEQDFFHTRRTHKIPKASLKGCSICY